MRAGGVQAVNASGYLILERGGAASHDHSDNYHRQPRLPVTLAANVAKLCRSSGGLAATEHDAVFFRGYGGEITHFLFWDFECDA